MSCYKITIDVATGKFLDYFQSLLLSPRRTWVVSRACELKIIPLAKQLSKSVFWFINLINICN